MNHTSVLRFFERLNISIQQGHFKLIKSDKDIYNVTQKISILNKCCSFELSINQRILKKSITVSTKILSSTTIFNTDNNYKCFSNSKSAY